MRRERRARDMLGLLLSGGVRKGRTRPGRCAQQRRENDGRYWSSLWSEDGTQCKDERNRRWKDLQGHF